MKASTLPGLTVIALFLSAAVLAQTASESPGPAVGSKVPDFHLSDQSGTDRSLRSLMGPKGMMLVFFRSADW
jgi:hypothetical protein